jgi:hypothetical protein
VTRREETTVDAPGQTTETLTTEQMIALLEKPEAADFAYRITQIYENVENVYNAALNVGTSSRVAASTNPQ